MGNNSSFYSKPWKVLQKLQKSHLTLFGEKEIQKKGDRRCWADPPPFRPSQAAQPASPPLSLPRVAPASLHPAPATWRPYAGVGRVLGILNANRKIRKRTDTDVAFTREYTRVSIFHRERECTN